jgi:hypothetical protein
MMVKVDYVLNTLVLFLFFFSSLLGRRRGCVSCRSAYDRYISWDGLGSERASERDIHMAWRRFLSFDVLTVMMAEYMKQGIHEMVVLYWI